MRTFVGRMGCGCAIAALVFSIGLDGGGAAADLSGLASQVREAVSGFRPITPSDLDAAAARVRSAIGSVPSSLKAAPAGDVEAPPAIDWQALEKQASNPAEADPAALREAERTIRSQSRGFAPPALRSLADATRRYARLVAASRNPAFEAEVGKQLGDLGAVLDKAAAAGPDAGGGFAGLEKAGPILESLDDTRQAPGVLAEVRRAVGRPNVFVEAHESLLGQAANRAVDEVAPIDEVILGIRQRGTGHTEGFVVLDLVPSENAAVLDLVLDATNHSNTRGGKGPVTVCSRGMTDLDARRRIQIEEERAYGLPVEAHASAHSETEGIGVRSHLGRNLIRNIASQRASRMRPQADAIAAGRARDRLRARFESQTREAIDSLASNYQTRFREPLLRHELYPEMLHHNTTDAAIHSIARKMLAGQVGAASAPPPPAEASVLSARMHQTAITNAATVWLAGRTITKEEVEEEYRRRNRPLPDVFKQDVEEDENDTEKGTGSSNGNADSQKPWSVRFAADKPLDLEVGDDRVTATLRGEAFTSGERTVGPMDVKATYRIEPSPSGARLVREGDIEIAPPGGMWRDGDKPNLDERVIRRRLRKRVERVLTDSIDVGPLSLPGQLETAGPLPIQQLASRKDGWITAGWRKKDPVVYETAPAEGQEVIGPGIQTSASLAR